MEIRTWIYGDAVTMVFRHGCGRISETGLAFLYVFGSVFGNGSDRDGGVFCRLLRRELEQEMQMLRNVGQSEERESEISR